MERDTIEQSVIRGGENFNSHAHVERDRELLPYLAFVDNFNSHAHVERDIFPPDIHAVAKISTHTLTWSVTAVAISQFQSVKFQLTRSRGA